MPNPLIHVHLSEKSPGVARKQRNKGRVKSVNGGKSVSGQKNTKMVDRHRYKFLFVNYILHRAKQLWVDIITLISGKVRCVCVGGGGRSTDSHGER